MALTVAEDKELRKEEIKYGDPPDKVTCWIECNLGECGDKIIVAKGWCKKCGVCAAFCPAKALDIRQDGYPCVNNEKCVSCGTCEIMCPDFAITCTQLKNKTNKA